MTDKTDIRPASDADLVRNIAIVKHGVETRVGEIKRDLEQWLEETTSSADHTPVSIALLELACDRYLAIYNDAVEASKMIQAVFRRAVRRRNGSLQ